MKHERPRCGLATAPFLLAALFTGPSGAEPLAECAPSVAPAELRPGQLASGFTVREGEAVEAFSVEVLGVDRGALGPGKDLIVVDTSGPVIDAGGGGISAGMSGSPVYTEDGRLIGAIAYRFSAGPSSIGGVTPAPDMLQVFNEGSGAAVQASGAATARLDFGIRTRIAHEARLPVSSVAGEMSRLQLPVLVSGAARSEQLDALREHLERAGARVIVGHGARAAALAGPPAARLAPGDALAAAMSFGDVTVAATGTTTYVCDGKALAFGHPFAFSGATVLGASRARVLRIVRDPTFGPFKLASLGEPVGIVDRDRFSAIRVRFGVEIPIIPAIQDTTALDTGNQRLAARTDVVGPTGAPLGVSVFARIAASHSLANLDQTFDQVSGGSAFISWTIAGVRTRTGQSFTLARANRFASRSDIAIEATGELFMALRRLAAQDFEPIEFAGLDVHEVSVERTVRRFRIERALWARNGRRFADVDVLRARPGDTVRARVELRALDDLSIRTETMRFRIPGGSRRGVIRITGGADGVGDGPDPFEDEPEEETASGFDALLAELAGDRRNDALIGRTSFRSSPIVRIQDRIVTGSDRLRLKIARRR